MSDKKQENLFYHQPRTAIQSVYYDFHVRNGRGACMFPFIDEPHLHYLARYVLMNEFHRRLHPFTFLEPGDTAVMVGVHDGFIELGYSTLFIMSAIVGPRGHVYAIDPDERNIRAIEQYCRKNNVENITTIQQGVWSEKATLEFTFFRDFSSSNEVRTLFDGQRDTCEQLWGAQRIERESYTQAVEVDTLDAIIERSVGEAVDFLNVTINGAEGAAITGASRLIQRPSLKIAFPLQRLDDPLYKTLADAGFRIAVADAPTKAWDETQFLYGCATRDSSNSLRERGFVPAVLHTDPDHPHLFDIGSNCTAVETVGD